MAEGVDDDHSMRLARITARSPSHPEPRMARASSRSSPLGVGGAIGLASAEMALNESILFREVRS
jgi:hypothetical protein